MLEQEQGWLWLSRRLKPAPSTFTQGDTAKRDARELPGCASCSPRRAVCASSADRHRSWPATGWSPVAWPAASIRTATAAIIAQCGVRHFVDLTEPGETTSFGKTPLSPYRVPDGCTYLRWPTVDNTPPENLPAVLDYIDARMASGGVYVHCRGGVGRTATVLGCWLAKHGCTKPQKVLDELRWQDRKRGARNAPETVAQRRAIQEYS